MEQQIMLLHFNLSPVVLVMRSAFAKALLFLIVCLGTACNHNKALYPEHTLFELVPVTSTHITFENKVIDDGDFNVFSYRNFYNGGGVAIGDINNDGKPDVFFTSNQGSNKLYLNHGNWKFEDITVKAHLQGERRWHTGVTMADINGDGWLDIYVCNSGGLKDAKRENELYINQKNGTFKEQAQQYGLADKGLSTQALFFDYDHDGDLDCFMLNNSYRPIGSFGYAQNLRNQRDPVNGDRFYRNDNGHFTDISEKAGIYGSEIGFGLGIGAADFFNTGWDDLYISNDFFEHDYFYKNQRGAFKEISNDAIAHMSLSSMGSDMADINNDGNIDIFTTDMLPENDYRLKTTTKFDEYDIYNAKLKSTFHHQFTTNCLQLNNGDGTFSEIADMAGVNATDWSWGALCFDFNNDGWKDIYVSNGISRDLTNQDFLSYFSSDEVMKEIKGGGFKAKQFLNKMPKTPVPSYGFLNQKNLTFKNETNNLGFYRPGFSNGAAYGDLDGDGDLDLVVNNENVPAFVYRNTTSERTHANFIKIKLKGSRLNSLGVGAKVTVYTALTQQLIEQMPTRGFQSSVEPVLTFGIGTSKTVDSVKIVWPGMKMQVLKNLPVNKLTTVAEANADLTYLPVNAAVKTLYSNITNSAVKGNITHKENDYKDFDEQRLIPKMLSTEGPKLAVADVNGDKLDDFFVGGATGDTAKLFVQQPDGNFIAQKQPAFDQDKNSEDIGALFFDADHDGDMDLAVASGGNMQFMSPVDQLVRLYINDGKGRYTRRFTGWPAISMNASCIRLNPANGDLFIGARSVPGAYGTAPASRLLRNDGHGNFTDVTPTAAPVLLKLGMVTDAQWADIDGSGKYTLAVVGDWMPVTLLNYRNSRLIKTSELPNSWGWWNCLTVADMDADGKPDLIAGNNGLNSKVKATSKYPAQLYVSDFDQNGQVECVPVYYKSDNKAYPFNLHDDMIRQMPYLKKKFLRYDVYAGKSINEIFTPEELEKAKVLTVNQSQSGIFYNKGHQQFTMQPLPLNAQISPAFSILPIDINHDGVQDLFIGGNFYGLKPEMGRYDASYGITLLGNKKHYFTYLPAKSTGLSVKGEVRATAAINTNKGKTIIVARNNDALQLFRERK